MLLFFKILSKHSNCTDIPTKKRVPLSEWKYRFPYVRDLCKREQTLVSVIETKHLSY